MPERWSGAQRSDLTAKPRSVSYGYDFGRAEMRSRRNQPRGILRRSLAGRPQQAMFEESQPEWRSMFPSEVLGRDDFGAEERTPKLKHALGLGAPNGRAQR